MATSTGENLLPATSVPVLVCGAGPIGLMTSALLGKAGIRNLVIEKHKSTLLLPKARLVRGQTMDIFQELGVETMIREVGYPQGQKRIAWVEEIGGRVIVDVNNKKKAKEAQPSSTVEQSADAGLKKASDTPPTTDVSRDRDCLVAQWQVERVLQSLVKTLQPSDLRFSTELLTYEQKSDGTGVVCTLLDRLSGQKQLVECQYLVGSDGSRSRVRDLMGVSTANKRVLTILNSIYFDAPGGTTLIGENPSMLTVLTSKRVRGDNLFCEDFRERWTLIHNVDPDTTEPLNEADATELVHVAFGTTNNKEALGEVKIVGSRLWDMAEFNSDKYRDRNVFLVGDAAHQLPPTGGLGMNSGFQSAVNLSRRLIQVLQSKGIDGSSLDSSQKEALLDGYFEERHAVVGKIIKWAIKNHETHTAMMEAIAEEDLEKFHALAASQRTHVRGIDQVTGDPFEVESVAMHMDSAGRIPNQK